MALLPNSTFKNVGSPDCPPVRFLGRKAAPRAETVAQSALRLPQKTPVCTQAPIGRTNSPARSANFLLVPFCPFLSISRSLKTHSLTEECDLDDQKMVALCEGLQACPALEELSLGE